MAIGTISFTEWIKKNPSVVSNAIKDNFLQVARTDLVSMMNQYLTALGDGVFIGKYSHETWGTVSYMQPWQTAEYGIKAANADAIVIQYGGYRLGIALDEVTLPWGSNTATDYGVTADMNSFDGKNIMSKIMSNAAIKDDDPSQYGMAYAWNYSKSHTGDPGGDSTIGAHSWWMPTMADLSLILDHFETINLAIDRINAAGKQTATRLQRTNYWSCQAYGAGNARLLGFSSGVRGFNSRGGRGHVRPVTAF